MACRSFEYGAVVLEERLVVRGDGYSVGSLVLVGEADVVVYMVALLIGFLHLGEGLLEEGAVFRGYGEDQLHAAVVVAHVLRAFHEMLCEGCALLVRVGVEFEHSLRLGAVA